jgi:hypothetical protein
MVKILVGWLKKGNTFSGIFPKSSKPTVGEIRLTFRESFNNYNAALKISTT